MSWSTTLNNGHVFLPREKLLFATSQLLGRDAGRAGAGAGQAYRGLRRGGKDHRRGAGLLSAPAVPGGDLRGASACCRWYGRRWRCCPGRRRSSMTLKRNRAWPMRPLQRQAVCAGGPGRCTAADRRPRHRQDHLPAGHRGPVRAYGPGCVLLLAPTGRAAKRLSERDGPGGPDHPPCPGHELQ